MDMSGVMVGQLCLRMRVAGGISMITRAACMLGGSDALPSKPIHAIRRAEATRVLESSRTRNIWNILISTIVSVFVCWAVSETYLGPRASKRVLVHASRRRMLSRISQRAREFL